MILNSLLKKISIGTILFYLITFLIVIWTLFPVGWSFVTSIKTHDSNYSWPPTFIPKEVTFDHFLGVFKKGSGRTAGGFWDFIVNSLIIAFSTTFITILISITTGYGLYHLGSSNWGRVGIGFILGSRLIPPISLLVPYTLISNKLGITDTYIAIIAAHVFFVGPFAIWIMRNFFQSVPSVLEEAAEIDGSSELNTYLKVILPTVQPGIVAIAIISFLWSWKEFIFAFTLSRRYTVTLPVGLAKFLNDDFITWGQLNAAAMISLIPGIIFVVIFHKQLMEGLIAGTGIKQ